MVPKKLLTHPTKSEGDGRRSDTSINRKQQKLPDNSATLTAAPKKRCCPQDHTVLHLPMTLPMTFMGRCSSEVPNLDDFFTPAAPSDPTNESDKEDQRPGAAAAENV